MLLGDLVLLGQVRIDVVLPVKFDQGKNAASETQRRFDCEIQAFFVENWQHAWETKVYKVGHGVRLRIIRTSGS